jgi:hypothetical protein
VYRNVKEEYLEFEDGQWHLTRDAFLGGKKRRISVDRAKLCVDGPKHTQVGEDCVCSLAVTGVRAIDLGFKMTPKGKIEHRYEACVEATPRTDNKAHADIYAAPEKVGKRAFRLLQEALIELAEWPKGFSPSDKRGPDQLQE